MSSHILIGIPSYLPSDVVLHRKRLNAHCKQLREIRDMFPFTDIVEIDQMYSEGDVRTVRGIMKGDMRGTYENVTFNRGLGVGGAKNKILEYFYSHDYDILFLWDDDAFVYPYYGVDKFPSDLLNYFLNHRNQMLLIRSLAPMQVPFKLQNYRVRNEVKQGWLLNPSITVSASGGFILTNTKKYQGYEVYIDESLNPSEGTGYEDYDFFLSLLEKGVSSYICNQMVCKLYLNNSSTIFSKNTVVDDSKEVRLSNHSKNLMAVYDRHPNIGIRYHLIDNHLKTNIGNLPKPHPLYVPRAERYEFTKNLIPSESLTAEDRITRKSLI